MSCDLIFTGLAVNFEFFDLFERLNLMTDHAVIGLQLAPVPQRFRRMNPVAGEAGDIIISLDNDIPNILLDMSIYRVKLRVVRLCEIEFEVLKKVVPAYKIIRVGQPG